MNIPDMRRLVMQTALRYVAAGADSRVLENLLFQAANHKDHQNYVDRIVEELPGTVRVIQERPEGDGYSAVILYEDEQAAAIARVDYFPSDDAPEADVIWLDLQGLARLRGQA